MQDNIRYKINSYLQLLKYIDNAEERANKVVIVSELLDMIPNRRIYSGKGSPTKEECMDTIVDLFGESDTIDSQIILDILESKGFSKGTIDRAKQELGIESKHEGGFSNIGKWKWILRR